MAHHRIGLIVPSSNTTMETEVPAFMGNFAADVGATLSFHSARVRMRHVRQEELEAMNRAAADAMDLLCDAPVEAVGYACLVAIMAMGKGYHRVAERELTAVARAAGREALMVTSAGALVDELHAMGARRVVMVMPYADELARCVVDYVESEGITVGDYRNMRVTDNVEVARIPAAAVLDTAATLDQRGADAVVLSACVQMPSLHALEVARARTDIPVLSASLCTARRLWSAVSRTAAEEGTPPLVAA